MTERWLCPLCKQPVSKHTYHEITGIWEDKQKLVEQYRDKFKKMNSQMNDKVRKAVLQEQRKYQKMEGQIKRNSERLAKEKYNKEYKINQMQWKQKESNRIQKTQTQNKQLADRVSSLTRTSNEQQKKIKILENQLTKQRTPQVDGLLYEGELLKTLKFIFPDDRFQHTGKGGDIVHSVIYKDNQVGIIVYECKKVVKFSKSHINQAAKAKCQRNADYSILVTNAMKKGFNGFTMEKGVIVIHPTGILSFVKFLRGKIIEIANMKISKTQKNKMVQGIIEYMESPQFKDSLESVIHTVKEEYEDLKKEVEQHCTRWTKRRDAYYNIYIEIDNIKQKTLNPLTGEKSKTTLPPKFILSLPEAKQG